jgi:hypothetical protein
MQEPDLARKMGAAMMILHPVNANQPAVSLPHKAQGGGRLLEDCNPPQTTPPLS